MLCIILFSLVWMSYMMMTQNSMIWICYVIFTMNHFKGTQEHNCKMHGKSIRNEEPLCILHGLGIPV